MSDRYAKQYAIRYDEIIMGRVLQIHGISQDRRLLIDVAALDGRAQWPKVPVILKAGVTRNYRRGQIVALAFRNGAAKFPCAVGHLVNLDQDPLYADPLPAPFQQIDDQVYYHAETGAFLRFRSATSTADTQAGAAGQPAIVEIFTASGHHVLITEQNGQQGITITTALGHVLHFDDTSNLQGITLTTKNGSLLHLDDVASLVTLLSKGNIALQGTDVGVGDKFENLSAGNSAITNDHLKTIGSSIDNERLADLKALVNAMVAAGIPSAPALQATVNAWTVQTIGATPIPIGSSTVRIKE